MPVVPLTAAKFAPAVLGYCGSLPINGMILAPLNARFADYWLWSPKSPYRNRVPGKIVEIFEKHGHNVVLGFGIALVVVADLILALGASVALAQAWSETIGAGRRRMSGPPPKPAVNSRL